MRSTEKISRQMKISMKQVQFYSETALAYRKGSRRQVDWATLMFICMTKHEQIITNISWLNNE